MAMTRPGFDKALAPGYRKITFESYKERPIEGKSLVNWNTTKRAYEEDFPIAGFGTLLAKPEGAAVSMQDALQGSAKRYTWTTYALGYRITVEMYEDDLYGIFGNKMAKALGRAARNNLEIILHSPYNNAFDTAYSGYVSGESLCGDHTGLRGGTQRNRPTTDADFGLLALQAAIEHFHGLEDESGIPAVFIPKKLIYNVGDHWLVQQTLKSQFLPGTDLNDINQVANEGLSPHLSHYLTDADAWFLLCDQHEINYFERRALAMSNATDWDTGDAKYKVTRRHGAGWSDWRGVYGSQGA